VRSCLMRTASTLLALVGVASIALVAPSASAQQTAVQPVPYSPSAPVPAPPPLPQDAPPPPVSAAAPGNDVIVLKGGGMMRGRLVEVIPNDHATIQLPTGQSAIVAWSRIERVEQAAPAGAPPPAPTYDTAMIHVDVDREVLLEGRKPDGIWETVCQAPCDATVRLDYEYRFAGEGVRTSRTFSIHANPGQRVVLTVKPGSKGGFTGGIVLASLTPLVLLTGFVVWGVGELEGDGGNGAVVTGSVIMLASAIELVAGIVLIASNAKTSYSEELAGEGPHATGRPSRPLLGAALRKAPESDAWLRTPTWNAPSDGERLLPRAETAPLFSHSF